MLLIAHRGLSDVYPENSLIAFKKALEHGAMAIELDIRPTSDDEFVIIHDATTARISNKKLKVRNSSLESLSKLNISYPEKFGNDFKSEKILTLDDFIENFKDRCLLITELKGQFSEDLLKKLIEKLEKFDTDSVIISSKNINNLELLRKIGFDGNIAYIYGRGKINWKKLKELKIHSIHVKRSKLTSYILKRIRRYGFYVYVWTVDKPYEIRKMAHLGVDGIFTNNVVLAKLVLDSINKYVHYIPPAIAKRFLRGIHLMGS